MPSRTCPPLPTSRPWLRPRASGGSACTGSAASERPGWPGHLSSCWGLARSASGPSSQGSPPSPTCSSERPAAGWSGFRRWRAVLAVELGPRGAPPSVRVGDLPDEFLDERGFGVQQRQPVLLFDQEQFGHALGKRGVDEAADLGACPVELVEAVAQQRNDLARRQRREQRQRGHEVRVLMLWFCDQFAQPVAELGPAIVGQRIDGALGALPGPGGFNLRDVPGLGQLANDHVQGSVVELDAAFVAVLAQGAAQLVGVHGLLRQVRHHREREQVADLAFPGHRSIHPNGGAASGGTPILLGEQAVSWVIRWCAPGRPRSGSRPRRAPAAELRRQVVRAGSSTVGKPPSACARRRSARYSRENMADSWAMPPRWTRISPCRSWPVSTMRLPPAAFRPSASLTRPRPSRRRSQSSTTAPSGTSSLSMAWSSSTSIVISPSSMCGERRSSTAWPRCARTWNSRAVVQLPRRLVTS